MRQTPYNGYGHYRGPAQPTGQRGGYSYADGNYHQSGPPEPYRTPHGQHGSHAHMQPYPGPGQPQYAPYQMHHNTPWQGHQPHPHHFPGPPYHQPQASYPHMADSNIHRKRPYGQDGGQERETKRGRPEDFDKHTGRGQGSWTQRGGSGRPNSDAVRLNRDIAGERNPLGILNIVEQNHDKFDAVNVSTCLHRVAKNAMVQDLPNIMQHPGFAILRAAIPKHISGFKAQQLANSLWAFATMGYQALEQEIVDVITDRSLLVTHNFNPQNVANILWAYAKLERHPPKALVDALLERAKRQLFDFEPQNLSNLIWALANLDVQPTEELLQVYEQAALQKLHGFSAQAVKDTLWGYATLDIKPSQPFVEACVKRIWELLNQCEPQHVGNLLWALAKMEHFPGNQLLDDIVTKMSIEMKSFNAQNVSNVAWAMGALGYVPDEAFLRQLAKYFLDTMDQFSPQGLENVLWAFATMGYIPDEAVLDAVAQHSLAKMREFNQQSVVLLLWAYARIGYRPSEDLLVAATTRAVTTLRDASPQNVTNMLWSVASLEFSPPSDLVRSSMQAVKALLSHPQFNAQAVSNSLWAVANMLDVWEEVQDQEFLNLLAAKTVELMDQFKAQNIANTMWAYAKLGADPGPAVRQACIESSLAKLEDFTAQNLANIVWSFATLDQYPGDDLPAAVCAQTLAELDKHSGHSLSSILWALETLRFDPGEKFMSTVMEYALSNLVDFTPQALALTLQAYARLNYPPSAEEEAMFLDHITSRIEEFDVQALGNTLWSVGVLHCKNPTFWNTVLRRFSSLPHDGLMQNFRQMYQAYLMVEMDTNGDTEAFDKPDWLVVEGKQAWLKDVSNITISKLHEEVSNRLLELGYPHENEYKTEDMHFSIDIVLPGLMIALEVDGPCHFCHNTRRELGSTKCRRELLMYRGFKVVQLRHWEWYELQGATERQRQYLAQLLAAADVPLASACSEEQLYGGARGRGTKVPPEEDDPLKHEPLNSPDRPALPAADNMFSPQKLNMPAPKADAPVATDMGPTSMTPKKETQPLKAQPSNAVAPCAPAKPEPVWAPAADMKGESTPAGALCHDAVKQESVQHSPAQHAAPVARTVPAAALVQVVKGTAVHGETCTEQEGFKRVAHGDATSDNEEGEAEEEFVAL